MLLFFVFLVGVFGVVLSVRNLDGAPGSAVLAAIPLEIPIVLESSFVAVIPDHLP